jgi:hypothetical protein
MFSTEPPPPRHNFPPFPTKKLEMPPVTMGLMQVSFQFPGISVTTLEVLYVVYIIIMSVHQKF